MSDTDNVVNTGGCKGKNCKNANTPLNQMYGAFCSLRCVNIYLTSHGSPQITNAQLRTP